YLLVLRLLTHARSAGQHVLNRYCMLAALANVCWTAIACSRGRPACVKPLLHVRGNGQRVLDRYCMFTRSASVCWTDLANTVGSSCPQITYISTHRSSRMGFLFRESGIDN